MIKYFGIIWKMLGNMAIGAWLSVLGRRIMNKK